MGDAAKNLDGEVAETGRGISRFTFDRKDFGREDTLRYIVLRQVISENYDGAIRELRDFFKQDFDYPQFKERAERYVNHSIGLVNAIRAKKNFPGLNSMTAAKQQEIFEKIHQHYQELLISLKQVEKIQLELKMTDMRSTAIVLKTTMYSIFFVVAVAFAIEASRGLFGNFLQVSDEILTAIIDYIFSVFKL